MRTVNAPAATHSTPVSTAASLISSAVGAANTAMIETPAAKEMAMVDLR